MISESLLSMSFTHKPASYDFNNDTERISTRTPYVMSRKSKQAHSILAESKSFSSTPFHNSSFSHEKETL